MTRTIEVVNGTIVSGISAKAAKPTITAMAKPPPTPVAIARRSGNRKGILKPGKMIRRF